MDRPPLPRAADLRAVHALVHECRELGDDVVAWRAHWVAGLARLIDADCGFSGELAGLRTGRHRDLGNVGWGFDRPGIDPAGYIAGMAYLADNPGYSVGLPAYAAHPAAGTALSIPDLLPADVWEQSAEYQTVYRVVGTGGPLYCLLPLPGDPDAATGEVFCRTAGRPDFSREQKATLTEATAAVAPLVGGPLARFAEPSPADLSPRVRQVLGCFLAGSSDKQVMATLGLTRHTVNQYAKAIYRHFGVTSRPELLARWIRRGWPVGRWAEG